MHPGSCALCTCARVHARRRGRQTWFARCELVKVPNPRGYRRRGSCARHGPVDSINGNNATSVRRFIDDAIELRRPLPCQYLDPPISFYLCFFVRSIVRSSATNHPSNCQSSCNNLEKASFERGHGWKRRTSHYVATCRLLNA